jgi:hypothetical protein
MDKYYTTHKVYIDEEDLEDEYDYEVIIQDSAYDDLTEFDSVLEIDIDEDDIDWDDIVIE